MEDQQQPLLVLLDIVDKLGKGEVIAFIDVCPLDQQLSGEVGKEHVSDKNRQDTRALGINMRERRGEEVEEEVQEKMAEWC